MLDLSRMAEGICTCETNMSHLQRPCDTIKINSSDRHWLIVWYCDYSLIETYGCNIFSKCFRNSWLWTWFLSLTLILKRHSLRPSSLDFPKCKLFRLWKLRLLILPICSALSMLFLFHRVVYLGHPSLCWFW